MISMSTSSAQRDPIVFTGEIIEHSWIVEALLGVLYHSDMSFLTDGIRTHILIELVEKWDFVHVKDLIHGGIARHVSDGKQSVTERFELSLQLKDPHLAAPFIRDYNHKVWGGTPAPDPGPAGLPFLRDNVRQTYETPAPGLKSHRTVSGGQIFDLGTWRYETFLKLPPTTVWALLRATVVGTSEPAEIDYGSVAREFERLLTLACE
jgi:hypothetical protein